MQKLKIGVKGIKDTLTREEMRDIGGSLSPIIGIIGDKEPCNCNTKDTCGDGQGCMSDCEPANGFSEHCAKNS